jgi:hypothetical protein
MFGLENYKKDIHVDLVSNPAYTSIEKVLLKEGTLN